MAQVLRTFDWSRVSRNNETPRRRYYPWDDWFDGRIWALEGEGEDFDGPAVSMEKVIRSTATKHGYKVRVRITDETTAEALGVPQGSIVMQRHDDDERATGTTRSPSLKSLREAAEAEAAQAEVVRPHLRKRADGSVVNVNGHARRIVRTAAN